MAARQSGSGSGEFFDDLFANMRDGKYRKDLEHALSGLEGGVGGMGADEEGTAAVTHSMT